MSTLASKEAVPLTCDQCGGVGGLFARVDLRVLCVTCWNKAGRPSMDGSEAVRAAVACAVVPRTEGGLSADIGSILEPALSRAHNDGCLKTLRLAGRQCVAYADKVAAVMCDPEFRDEIHLEAQGEERAARFLGEMFLRIADECEPHA